MKKQKGISFIEINVSIVLFLIVAVCIIGMLANCTLWVRKTTELRQCIHLAQWKMAETQYMTETDIREGSDKFPAPFNNYTWRIQKLTPADPRLEGFTEIKVTAIGLTGTKHSLVILKARAPQVVEQTFVGGYFAGGFVGIIATDLNGNQTYKRQISNLHYHSVSGFPDAIFAVNNDGNKIVYQTKDPWLGGQYHLYYLDISDASAQPKLLFTSNYTYEEFFWIPNNRIVYTETTQVYIYNPSGANYYDQSNGVYIVDPENPAEKTTVVPVSSTLPVTGGLRVSITTDGDSPDKLIYTNNHKDYFLYDINTKDKNPITFKQTDSDIKKFVVKGVSFNSKDPKKVAVVAEGSYDSDITTPWGAYNTRNFLYYGYIDDKGEVSLKLIKECGVVYQYTGYDTVCPAFLLSNARWSSSGEEIVYGRAPGGNNIEIFKANIKNLDAITVDSIKTLYTGNKACLNDIQVNKDDKDSRISISYGFSQNGGVARFKLDGADFQKIATGDGGFLQSHWLSK